MKGRKAEWLLETQRKYGTVLRQLIFIQVPSFVYPPDFVVTSDIENVKFIYGQKHQIEFLQRLRKTSRPFIDARCCRLQYP